MAKDISIRMRRLAAGLSILGLAATLTGCIEPLPLAQVGKGDIRNAIAKGQLTSPKAATVALVSLEGAPAAVETQFRQAFTTEAANREITLTDQVSARYLLRGYVSAYPSDAGVTVSYAYDVFDAGARRRQDRIADTIDVPGNGGDPWSAVNAAVVATLASHSADDLAIALGGMPEAQAAKVATAGATPVPAIH